MMTFFTPSLCAFETLDVLDNHLLRTHSNLHNARRQLRTVEPAYSFKSENDRGLLEIEMPGVQKEDVSVEVHGKTLKVTGKRFRFSLPQHAATATKVTDKERSTVKDDLNSDHHPAENGPKDAGAQRMEKHEKHTHDEANRATFYKIVFRMTDKMDPGRVRVESYQDGVLRLHLQNKEEEEPRTIVIE